MKAERFAALLRKQMHEHFLKKQESPVDCEGDKQSESVPEIKKNANNSPKQQHHISSWTCLDS